MDDGREVSEVKRIPLPPLYNRGMTLGTRTAEDEALDALALGTHDDPFAVLGRHEIVDRGRPALLFRTIQPSADSVELVTPEGAFVMKRRRPEGVFEVTLPLDAIPLGGARAEEFAYRFRLHEGGRTRDVIDPFQFGQVLTDFDLHLIAEGTHYRAWEKLGAHRREIGGVPASISRSGRRMPSASA